MKKILYLGNTLNQGTARGNEGSHPHRWLSVSDKGHCSKIDRLSYDKFGDYL